jgi:hypothetical protein
VVSILKTIARSYVPADQGFALVRTTRAMLDFPALPHSAHEKAVTAPAG